VVRDDIKIGEAPVVSTTFGNRLEGAQHQGSKMILPK
jgi:hypothetical protein